MMNVFVQMPGASAKEVEERITIPMEKKLMEIPGVEYVYSISRPGLGFAIVRFKVGEDEEKSIVKLVQQDVRQLRPHPARAPRHRSSSPAPSTTYRSSR